MGDEEEDDGNITNDVGDTSGEVRRAVGQELGRKKTVVHEPHSPPASRGARLKRKAEEPVVQEVRGKKSRSVLELGVQEGVEEQSKRNSDLFPADVRPDIFRSDAVFNALSFDKASTFVHEHGLMQAKIKLKERSNNSQEKADDKLRMVEVPAGADDAQEVLNTVARNLRPVNKEIKEQMSWLVTERKDVIRNLPLEVFGMADSVATKALELCHNLKSNLTIDMFSPGGKKAINTKTKACRTKDGELAVETSEVYGDLDNVTDVLIAWANLGAIWQRIFPWWPAAIIAMQVIFKMKMFAHCGEGAKKVMIKFSNKILTSNAQGAASKKGPLTFERALNVAGNTCLDLDYAKDPIVGKTAARPAGGGDQTHQGRGGAGLRGRGGGRGGGRGRGGSAFDQMVKLGGDSLCPFFQVGRRRIKSCEDLM